MVLLDERDGRYWQLNSTGATVLQALLDGAGPQQIADRKNRWSVGTTRYGTSRETLPGGGPAAG
ncbi:PqqD family peptide modification chaperone [Streptomyces sp. NPDC057963]|uniref:PqqD family peptide modification chaperone n=1 Tax=Streptomyces sp. NPDC057963 TaxID=3346290 RepID=UPI0036E64798